MKRRGITTICFIWLAVFLALSMLLYFTCRYTLVFGQCKSTMYYITSLILDRALCVGGVCDVISGMITQFFVSPLVAVVVTGAILTAIALLFASVLYRVGKAKWLLPLSLLPSVALAFMHCNPSYDYASTVAFLLMLLVLTGVSAIHKHGIRFVIGLISAVLLYLFAGPVALLFAIAIVLVERHLVSLVYPVLICLIAWLGVRSGWFADFSQALTPKFYYTAWQSIDITAWLPYTALIVVLLIAVFSKSIVVKGVKMRRGLVSASCVVVLVFSLWGFLKLSDPVEEKFSELSFLVSCGNWQGVIESARSLPTDDLRYHNCRNLALAETGQLAKVMFQYPCAGPSSIIDMESKSPEMYMLLSDIFYSMGHISLSQKYAFEANEGVGNFSPRMLKRLVDTNIILGQYAVAEKYIDMLSSTLYYKDWAEDRRKLLADPLNLTDAELAAKRACIPMTDDMAGIYGIEHDLLAIVRTNPQHGISMDYLGMLCLASKNVPKFTDIISEFYGSPALAAPLPKHFQEAIAVATLATDSRLDLKYNLHPSTVENCRQFWAKHKSQPNTFWHYLKHSER